MECRTVLICDVSSLLLVPVGLLCPIHTTSTDEISPFSTDSIHAFTSKAFFRRRFEKNIEWWSVKGIGCKISGTNFHILGGYYFVTSFYGLNSDLLACRGRNCEINRLYIEAVIKINGHSSFKESAFKVIFIVKLQCLYIKEIWCSYLSNIGVFRLFIWSKLCIYRGHEAVGKPTGRAIQYRIGGGSNRCQNIWRHHDPPRKQSKSQRTGN